MDVLERGCSSSTTIKVVPRKIIKSFVLL